MLNPHSYTDMQNERGLPLEWFSNVDHFRLVQLRLMLRLLSHPPLISVASRILLLGRQGGVITLGFVFGSRVT